MYDAIHEMRTRIITSKSFSDDKILGAILFEDTMDREIDGIPTGRYLWEKKGIVPFLKCDKGLANETNGVQLMKPMPGLNDLLVRCKAKCMFGTKMRSVIHSADPDGIKAVVDQQFDVGRQILRHGLIPILEPEINIQSPDREKCEELLKAELLTHLDELDDDQKVMLKLSLPTRVNFYRECVDHPNCLRVVALSGGYSRAKANDILSKQTKIVASFSRALSEGLRYDQTDDEFDNTLADAVDSIFEASKAG